MSDKSALPMAITHFKNVKSKAGELRQDTWGGVIDMITNAPTYREKSQQTLFKLGVYENNSRAPENDLIEISGIEIDYDSGAVTMEEAAQHLCDAGIESIVYSTFTATEETHKWRVLLPLSRKTGAEHRAAWVAAADSVLGNIAARESFTPKQIFFYGQGDNHYQVIHCQGEYLDAIPATINAADDYVSQQAPPPTVQQPAPPKRDYSNRTESPGELADKVRIWLNHISPDLDRTDWLKIVSAAHDVKLGGLGKELVRAWSERSRKGNKNFDAEWDSFNSRHECTVGTIRRYAEQYGYKDEPSHTPPHRFDSSSHNTGKPQREPIPLPPELAPVPKFDYQWLPPAFAEYVEEVARQMATPPDFVAWALLATAGTVIGLKVGIRPQRHTTWTESSTQWVMCVGRPGFLKSPAIAAGMKPLNRLTAAATRIYKEAKEEYEQAAEFSKIEAEVKKKQLKTALSKPSTAGGVSAADLVVDVPEEPIQKRYQTSDPNQPSMLVIMRENPNGILLFRDELMGFLYSLNRDANAGFREMILEAHNGFGSHTEDRMGRGRNIFTERVCLSVMGGTQPGKIAPYVEKTMSGGVGDDGLLQRFNLIWPDPVPFVEVDEPPSREKLAAVHRVFRELDELTAETAGAVQDYDERGELDGVPYVRFQDDAQALFKSWRKDLMERVRAGSEHPAMESQLSKYPKVISGLALIQHLCDGGRGAVGKVPLLRALALAEYLEAHANRVYTSVTMPKVSAAKQVLIKISEQKLSNPFVARDIKQAGWAGLNSTTVPAALDLLVDHYWLHADEEPPKSTGGRPTVKFYLNPLAEGRL